MPSAQHVLMGRCAYEALPAWERAFWKGQRETIIRESLAPDLYYRAPDRYGPYCRMPNGQLMPHAPTDEKWSQLPFVRAPVASSYRYVIQYYLGKLVETIATGNRGDSAMFAAVFGHFLQDSAQPAHLVHNDWLYQLVQRPAGRYRHLHRDLDNADPDVRVLRQIRPRLLGATLDEAAFQLRVAYERMTQAALSQLVPLVKAAYARSATGMTRAITDLYRQATELTASAWHTAHCIAHRKFDPKEVTALHTVRLNTVPYAHGFSIDPFGFRPLMNFACDGRGHTRPLRLKVDGRIRRFQEGIAMSWGNVVYDLPGGLYHEFRARIGLLSSTPPAAQAVFKIVLDGGPVVYEEAQKTILDYGGPIIFDSGVMTGATDSRVVVAPLGSATRITLIVECPKQNAQALWIEPVLVKPAGAPPRSRKRTQLKGDIHRHV